MIVQKSNPDELCHSGWLQVKEGGDEVKAKHWPKRYAELRKAKLVIYEATEQSTGGGGAVGPKAPLNQRELYHFTTLSMSLLQFPNAGRKKKIDTLFSITTSGGVTTFKATTVSERDRWLAELRRLVPLVKMENDQEMIQKKAEEQTAREVSEFQRQDALKMMLAAAERVGIKDAFSDYVDDLSKHLRQLLKDVGKVASEGMNVAKVIADTIVEIIDSSNSLLAKSSRMDVNKQVLTYTQLTTKQAVEVVSAAKTAAHDRTSKNDCGRACAQITKTVNDFLNYLAGLRGVSMAAPQKTDDRRTFKREARKSFVELNSMVNSTGVTPKRQPNAILKKPGQKTGTPQRQPGPPSPAPAKHSPKQGPAGAVSKAPPSAAQKVDSPLVQAQGAPSSPRARSSTNPALKNVTAALAKFVGPSSLSSGTLLSGPAPASLSSPSKDRAQTAQSPSQPTSELAELRLAHRTIIGAQETMRKAVTRRTTMGRGTVAMLQQDLLQASRLSSKDASPALLKEASVLVDETSELMALAIAAHEEYLRTNPSSEGAEFLIDAARLVTLATLKLVDVVDKDEGNEAIAAAACCLKGAVARLLMSSRIKLPATSPAGQKLNAAANKIYGSTQKITDIVRAEQENVDIRVDVKTGTLFLRQKQEALNELQGSELALEAARKDLSLVAKDQGGHGMASQKALLERSFLAQKKIADLERVVFAQRKIVAKLEAVKPGPGKK